MILKDMCGMNWVRSVGSFKICLFVFFLFIWLLKEGYRFENSFLWVYFIFIIFI